MREKVINWDFNALNPSDYEVYIELEVENRLLLYIFNLSKKKLSKKNINVENLINKINSFDIDPRFLNLLKTVIRPIINDIKGACRMDKIEVLSFAIKKAYFKRNKNQEWIVKIILTGQYADKR